MKRNYLFGLATTLGFAALWTITPALARQNIVVGDLSIRYDYQDRTYDREGALTVIPVAPGEDAVVDETSHTTPQPAAIILDDREGDRRNLIVSPRLTFTSNGINDLFELTYAPGVNYDDIDGTTDLDHTFGLRLEKNIKHNWLITLNDSFFMGDDPVRQEEEQASLTEANTQSEQSTVGSPAEQTGQGLTEVYGRRRYWTNTLEVGTQYGYGQDRTVDVTYSYDVLRNDTNVGGGYSEYDRHTGDLLLAHRFNAKWSAEGELNYSRGIFGDSEVYEVSPEQMAQDQVDDSDATSSSVDGAENTPVLTPVPLRYSQDLDEYDLRLRGGYNYSPHLQTFTEYTYLATDYASPLQNNYSVHNVAFGFDYDVSQHWHITLSGGPSWGSFDNSATETDYNAHGGLIWDFLHGSATVFVDKFYDQSNFDGRRSGLTDTWETGISADYQLTESLTATISANYTNNRRLEYPVPETVVVVGDIEDTISEETSQEQFGRILYREKDYDAGFTLNYSFWRWYTISSGYRYYKHDSDLSENGADSYHEHRAFVVLTYSKELFRW